MGCAFFVVALPGPSVNYFSNCYKLQATLWEDVVIVYVIKDTNSILQNYVSSV